MPDLNQSESCESSIRGPDLQAEAHDDVKAIGDVNRVKQSEQSEARFGVLSSWNERVWLHIEEEPTTH